MNNFSDEQLKTIQDLVDWIDLLKDEPEFSSRLKIWKRLRSDGADPWLLLQAFRKTGLFNG